MEELHGFEFKSMGSLETILYQCGNGMEFTPKNLPRNHYCFSIGS